MNPVDEFKKLISLFPENGELFSDVKHIPAALTPEPYQRLLVHDGHMTLKMEEFHRSSVTVEVLDRKSEGDIYSRKILLKRSDNGAPVQFAAIRFDLSFVPPAVRDEIKSERTPLGRILIEHNVICLVELGAILQLTAGPEFLRLCGGAAGKPVYGRLATIFCNQYPALDLFEVAAPVEW